MFPKPVKLLPGRSRHIALTNALRLRAAGHSRRVKADATCDIRSLFDANGDLRPITELSSAEALMIAGFEVVMKNATAGDGKEDRPHREGAGEGPGPA